MRGNEIGQDRRMAYVIFRLALGIDILIHGFGRIFGAGPSAFASKTAATFESTALPMWAAHGFLLVLPFVEAALGILLTLGLFTRWALAGGGALMVALIFGTSMRSDWTTVGIQMIYSIAYFLLLFFRRYDALGVDAFRKTVASD